MSRTFAPKSLLRHTSNALLQRYFHERGLLLDLEIATLRETDVAPILAAWQGLPAAERTNVDSDLARIDALAHERGVRTLLEEAQRATDSIADALEFMDGHHDRAMLAFLDAPLAFEAASLFDDVDGRPEHYWRRRKGVPRMDITADEGTRVGLGSAISVYLRAAQGRGGTCAVDTYDRRGALFFFAYPEDYGVTQMEYGAERTLERRTIRPAFEIVFKYCGEEGTLDVCVGGGQKVAIALQEVFARSVLRSELGPDSSEVRVFALNRLKDRGFKFVYPPESGISEARLKLVRFSTIGAPKDRTTLEVDPTASPLAIYDKIDRHFQNGVEPPSSLDARELLSLVNVSQVGIVVSFHRTRGRGRPTRTFNLSWPNACPLGHEGRDGVIREMLIASGIEPRTPTAAVDA